MTNNSIYFDKTSTAIPSSDTTNSQTSNNSTNTNSNLVASGSNNSNAGKSGTDTNAVGTPGSDNSVSTPPYYITRCDQVLHVNCKFIKDITHMCNQETGFFTLSTYRFNIFSTKDPSKLIVGYDNADFIGVPKLIDVSTNCIQFESKTGRVGVCFDNDKDARSVLEAYASFFDCRNGGDMSRNGTGNCRGITNVIFY